ncbi:MAG: ABC transporter ATP-binding protein [Christensenellales bacterium]
MIDLRRITRTFPPQERKSPPLPVLSDITLRIPPGQYAAMVGASGSGKSTLMNILGCLDRPTSGVYRLHGRDVSALPPDELAKVRGEEIGFVFQGFQLIPRLTAIENVMLPLILQGVSEPERRRARAEQLLLRVGLHSRMHHLPAALSGGQQQRVAIARALIRRPALILADEADQQPLTPTRRWKSFPCWRICTAPGRQFCSSPTTRPSPRALNAGLPCKAGRSSKKDDFCRVRLRPPRPCGTIDAR